MNIINVYNDKTLCTQIGYTIPSEPIIVKNYTNNLVFKAFGNNLHPTWEDLEDFLESRCIPRTRANIKDLIDAMGIDHYDPWLIVRKTKGKMAEDHQWIEILPDPDYIMTQEQELE